MAVRSTVLGALIVSDTATHDLVTCPAQTTYIVKDVRGWNGNAAAMSCSVYVQSTNNATATIVLQSVNASALVAASCWVVMRPGDRLRCLVGGGPFHIYVSGTRLDGVALSP